MKVEAFFVNSTVSFTKTHITYAKAMAINPPPILSCSIVVQSMIFISNPKIQIFLMLLVKLSILTLAPGEASSILAASPNKEECP
jgi:hypothetical protein